MLKAQTFIYEESLKTKGKGEIMKKKLISILAAAAMLFSLAAPALAYDGDPGFGLPWYGDEVTLGDFTAIEQFRDCLLYTSRCV